MQGCNMIWPETAGYQTQLCCMLPICRGFKLRGDWPVLTETLKR